MNKVILMGRFTRDPDIRWTQGQDQRCIARFTLAVDRRRPKTEGQQAADFIGCVAFGKTAEFIEKYMHKGTKVVLTGRIETGSYTNRDGQKVYTTDVICEDVEFAESKAAAGGNAEKGQDRRNEQPRQREAQADMDGFMNIPDGMEDQLPFS